ncbi:MAG TPA: hypothetical protein VHO92_09175 [Methanobacterium sp.]|nr:hypothetical protein [Methanobacterium sp.]
MATENAITSLAEIKELIKSMNMCHAIRANYGYADGHEFNCQMGYYDSCVPDCPVQCYNGCYPGCSPGCPPGCYNKEIYAP